MLTYYVLCMKRHIPTVCLPRVIHRPKNVQDVIQHVTYVWGQSDRGEV